MRVWVIVGLSGRAVTQPLLDRFGRNPEFFVAGNYGCVQMTLFALRIMLVLPVAGSY
jgi:hypothetical protein